MKKAIILIAVVLAVAGLGIFKVFNSISKAGEKADTVIAAFHRDFNARDAAAIHKSAGAEFQKTVALNEFTPFLETLHQKMGPHKSSERTGTNINTNNGDTRLEITCESTFANGAGTEEFIFDYNGEAPLLIGYNLKSPLLIEKPAASAETPAP